MSVDTHTYDNDTGFIRIDGDDIVDGTIDIDTAFNTISGTKSTFEYLLKKEDSSLASHKSINYPIRTREGCWEVIIPFGAIIGTGATMLITRPVSAGLTEYAKEIGKSKALKRIENKENKKSFEDAFKKLLEVIRIAQHLGVISNRRLLNVKFDGKKALLINEQGQLLSTTMEEIKTFQACPEKLLLQLASVVTDYRTLSVGYKHEGKVYEAVIDRDSKEIFSPDENQEPILPELVDGEYVTLEGYVTRGNATANNIGFRYKEHIITCEPSDGLITDYIQAHYRDCRIRGKISRTSKSEIFYGKRDRPKLYFDDLEVIKQNNPQTSLLPPASE